jgi:hypothetical protein
MELLLLPQLIRSIVDPRAAVDARMKEHGGGLLGKMFRQRSTTLNDDEKVYVFVFGGISFLELKEIRQVCVKGNPPISIRVISDTICSAISVLPRFLAETSFPTQDRVYVSATSTMAKPFLVRVGDSRANLRQRTLSSRPASSQALARSIS